MDRLYSTSEQDRKENRERKVYTCESHNKELGGQNDDTKK